MTKKIILISFVLAIFMFASCDTGIEYPEVTSEEAYTALELVYCESMNIPIPQDNSQSGSGWELTIVTTDTSETITYTLDNYEISGNEEYNSISGEFINIDSIDNDSVQGTFTLSGSGPVINIEFILTDETFLEFIANGHDMKDEVLTYINNLSE